MALVRLFCFYLLTPNYKCTCINILLSEFAAFRPPFKDDDEVSLSTDYQDFDSAKHNPVFYGNMHEQITTDMDCMQDVDVSKSHPSVIGYAFTDKPPASPKSPPPPLPDKKTCKLIFKAPRKNASENVIC